MKLTSGQSLPQYTETISEHNHRLVKGTSAISVGASESKSSAVFFTLSPNEDHRCGLTKVILRGTLVADCCRWYFPGYVMHDSYPMADIEISTYIPWFIW